MALLPLAFLFLSLPLSMADELLNSTCAGGRTFIPNSIFQRNLNTLVNDLSSIAPLTGFSKLTVGDNTDKVFGTALCRGDVIIPDRCGICLSRAYQDIQSTCPEKKEGTIFYEFCQLRYSDLDFFGIPNSRQFAMYNPSNVQNVAAFNQQVGKLLLDLTLNATSWEGLFAAGTNGDPNSEKAFALVQCTRDLSPKNCEACLKQSIDSSELYGNRSGLRIYGGSCILRIESYKFFSDTTIIAGNNKDKSHPVGVVIAAVVASLFLLFICVVAVVCIRRRRRHKEKGEGQEMNLIQDECLHFSLDDLKLATRNFSDENKLGRGGFGIVYKGSLADGELIAVKRLVTSAGQGFGELKNEVGVLAKVQHRNLVRLLGFCTQAQEKILVYEYMPNKSLDAVLFDSNRSKELTWDKRVNIIEGIAKGLLYLHEDSRMKIIHRDIKASNILLDVEMDPKLADFGLARIFNNEQSFENTRRIAGTQGYMAPEYMTQGAISEKSDVYSFGILLLEIITGKRCHGFRPSSSQPDPMGYISWLWQNGNPLQVLDANIQDGVEAEEVQKMIQIGLLCVQYDPRDRPNMSQVVKFLGSNSTSLPPITGPLGFNITDMTFNIESGETNILWQGYDVGSFTINSATLEPR